MRVGSFEEADQLQEELLKISPAVALDSEGVLAIDPDNLIHDVLYLRSERAEQLLNGKSVLEANKAVSILEVAQRKSWKVLGKTHSTTRAISKSLAVSETFRLDLRRREREKELTRLEAEEELLDDVTAVNSSGDSDSQSEKEAIEKPQSPQVVKSSTTMQQTQQRPRTPVDYEDTSDAQVLAGTPDDHKLYVTVQKRFGAG